jgi:nucleotide-binding universal stress UspA family protein
MDLFGKVAAASTFSPRFLPLLAEAAAVAKLLDRPFEIIHAGPESGGNRERFEEAFRKLHLSGAIHWRETEHPAEGIIQAVRDAGIGLLLAGAVERDADGRYFLGNVARTLVQDAPCSLLLFANPVLPPPPFRKLAAIVDYSDASRDALRAALDLAARSKAESLHVLRVFTVFAQILAEPNHFAPGGGAHAIADEEARLDAFVEEFDIDDIPIITHCIEGTTGFAAADFVQSIPADLLIIAGGASGGHALFPARMEWLENIIPANLLVVRSGAKA